MWEWCGEGPGDSVANFLRGVRSIWILKMRRYSQGEKEDGGHSRPQEERRPNHGSIGVRSLFRDSPDHLHDWFHLVRGLDWQGPRLEETGEN